MYIPSSLISPYIHIFISLLSPSLPLIHPIILRNNFDIVSNTPSYCCCCCCCYYCCCLSSHYSPSNSHHPQSYPKMLFPDSSLSPSLTPPYPPYNPPPTTATSSQTPPPAASHAHEAKTTYHSAPFPSSPLDCSPSLSLSLSLLDLIGGTLSRDTGLANIHRTVLQCVAVCYSVLQCVARLSDVQVLLETHLR